MVGGRVLERNSFEELDGFLEAAKLFEEEFKKEIENEKEEYLKKQEMYK